MKVLAITGGVGGAKLALGLSQVLSADECLFAVNTGDDFQHLGLTICPDIDSLTYALAQENNQELGWGRAGETWQFIETFGALGGEDWFRLGDKDMALHMRRTELMQQGRTLTEATAEIAGKLGIQHRIAPMSNDPVPTIVHTPEGDLPFQHYFVRERCRPKVTGFTFAGADQASLNPLIADWLADCDGVVICPSNPFVSVDPMLSLPGMRDALENVPVVAISPIVGGIALKGPAAKMMRELNVPASALAVARHYGGLLDGYIIDKTDETDTSEPESRLKTVEQIHKEINIPTIVAQTIMITLEDRVSLAEEALRLLRSLKGR